MMTVSNVFVFTHRTW